MLRVRKKRSRSPRYSRSWPWVLAWGIGLTASTLTLVGVAYVVGRKSSKDSTAIPDALLAAGSKAGTALAIAFAALLLGAWCLRHICLHWLAYRPGRIEVSEFRAASPISDADLTQYTVKFRRLLATLRLQAPAAVPGAAPEGDFLDVLGRQGADSRNILATLVNVLRAATPSHAYEVHGVLQTREARPSCGVIVQVVRLPSDASLPIVRWAETWDDALREAADDATSIILPRTLLCRAPWGAWSRYAMPAGLLHSYEEATRLEQDRRYDEALHEYYAAIELDPMNMVLRLRLGQLQERLGLYLDALATYTGMLAASKPAGTRIPWLRYRGRGRRERRRALHSARYRRNVLLGGRALADQWARQQRVVSTKRDEQKARLRSCLRTQLHETLLEYAVRVEPGHDRARACKRVRAALADPQPDEKRWAKAGQPHDASVPAVYLQRRELLGNYALDDSRRLRRHLARRPRDRATTLTRRAIALTEVCIDVRLRWVAHHAKTKSSPAGWPVPIAELDKKIRKIELGLLRVLPKRLVRRRAFRWWHEHYNAACAYALPLQGGDAEEELSVSAVRRLERATARADSAYIASRRAWLVSEDPDLVGLRTTNAFKLFELMYLPASEVTPRRPECVQQLEHSRYIRALLVETARRWREVWHARGRDLDSVPKLDEALRWFEHELETWDHVRETAEQNLHTATRYALIEHMRGCGSRYAFEPLDVPFPRYEERRIPETKGSSDKAGEDEVAESDAKLKALGRLLEKGNQPAVTLLGDLEQWQATLYKRAALAREPSRWLMAALCDHHAALWQLLAQWMEADDRHAATAQSEFDDKAEDTRALWCTMLRIWRAGPPAARLHLGRTRLELRVRYQVRTWSHSRHASRMAPLNGNGAALSDPSRPAAAYERPP